MTACSQTNSFIAAASSAANIPPQRGQLIPLLLVSGPIICGGLPPVTQYMRSPLRSSVEVVDLITSIRRIGPRRSYLWELAGAVCRNSLTPNRPIGVAVQFQTRGKRVPSRAPLVAFVGHD